MKKNREKTLKVMAEVEALSRSLKTPSYIWGGFTLDIYRGAFLREHHDIDYLTVDLFALRPQLTGEMVEKGWEVKQVVNGDLSIVANGINLHLGNITLDDSVSWTHNGKKGILLFPLHGLNIKEVDFCGTKVPTVTPEFEYVIKRYPHLLNTDWKPRPKDEWARRELFNLLTTQGINPESLLSRVISF